MRLRRLTIAALVLGALTGPVHAGEFDGSKPLVCALLELSSCESGSDCRKETPDSVNVPQFVFIDAKQNTISGTRPGGQTLSSKIAQEQRLGDLLVLDGAEGSVSWSINISQSTGKMSFASVGDGVAFIVFGACIGASPN